MGEIHYFDLPNGQRAFYQGPRVSEGPLPAFMYFALSGEESLCQEPINGPAASLKEENIRCFSFSLPHHDSSVSAKDAIKIWKQEFEKGIDFFTPFIRRSKESIEFLIREKIIDPEHLYLGGLSRGGFSALFLAANIPEVKGCVTFAPVTKLALSESFVDIDHHVVNRDLDIDELKHALSKIAHRIYIGNRDRLVKTEECFRFLQLLTETAYQSGIRSPEIEMVISPSIGHRGHGTPPKIFRDGAEWIKEKLKAR